MGPNWARAGREWPTLFTRSFLVYPGSRVSVIGRDSIRTPGADEAAPSAPAAPASGHPPTAPLLGGGYRPLDDGHVLLDLEIEHPHAEEIGAVLEGVLEALSRMSPAGAQHLVGDPRSLGLLHHGDRLIRGLRGIAHVVERLEVEIGVNARRLHAPERVGFVSADARDQAVLPDEIDELLKFGSSGISGESSSDLKKEVVMISKSIGHSLDHFNLIIYAFEYFSMQMPQTVIQNAL